MVNSRSPYYLLLTGGMSPHVPEEESSGTPSPEETSEEVLEEVLEETSEETSEEASELLEEETMELTSEIICSEYTREDLIHIEDCLHIIACLLFVVVVYIVLKCCRSILDILGF